MNRIKKLVVCILALSLSTNAYAVNPSHEYLQHQIMNRRVKLARDLIIISGLITLVGAVFKKEVAEGFCLNKRCQTTSSSEHRAFAIDSACLISGGLLMLVRYCIYGSSMQSLLTEPLPASQQV